MKLRLIAEAKHWWRFWSIRLNAAGLLILSFVQFDPTGALAVYNMMPEGLREVLPQNIVALAGGALFGLSMLSRVVVQKKLAERVDG